MEYKQQKQIIQYKNLTENFKENEDQLSEKSKYVINSSPMQDKPLINSKSKLKDLSKMVKNK